METAKKIRYALAISMALLVMVLLAAFINMRITIAGSNKETVVLGMIKNIEAIQLNAEHLAHLKDGYIKNGDEKYYIEYAEVAVKIKENKNELLEYSIKNNYKKEEVLRLANVAARNITNNNKLLDIKKYQDSSYGQIPYYDSIGHRQIDSVILLSGMLEKDAIGIFKNATAAKQKLNRLQLWLYLSLAVLFFASGYFAYIYMKGNFNEITY